MVSKSTDRSNSEWNLNANEKETSINPDQKYASNLHGSIDSKEACLFSVLLLCAPAL